MMAGTFDVAFDSSDQAGSVVGPAKPPELQLLVRVLDTTLRRLTSEIQSLAQTAELSFVRSLVTGDDRQETAPDLDALATNLLQHLNVSALQVLMDGPQPGGIVWGISARRLIVMLSLEQRHRLSKMVDELCAHQRASTEPYVLARGAELQNLEREWELPYLAQLQSLLIVPIRAGDTTLGAVIAGEERSWTRQPITQQAISVCLILARMIAGSVTQSRLVGAMIERGQFMQVLIDSLEDGVLTAKDGHIASWNQAAQRLFGYHADEVVGKPLADVLPGAPPELAGAVGGAEPREAAPRSFEWKMRTTGGRELFLLCTSTRLPETGVAAPTAMYVFREIGQERELEYLKDELLSSVSHELRTPLNGIYGFSRLLLERPHMPEAMRREALHSLQSSTERLTRMADDFIDVARARRHRLPIEIEDVDIAETVRSALRELKRRHAGHIVALRMEKNLPAVRADSLRVKQILDNLVSNAAKYSAEGTRILIAVRQRGGMVAISIVDRGCGIPQAVQDRVFEAFYRADNSRNLRASGVGLGLSIVKSLVEAHEGQVEVRSVIGRGSTFTFTLPIVPAVGA